MRRLRPDNTYLLLDDFGEHTAEDTGLTTELGVMSNEEEEHRQQGKGEVFISQPLTHDCTPDIAKHVQIALPTGGACCNTALGGHVLRRML